MGLLLMMALMALVGCAGDDKPETAGGDTPVAITFRCSVEEPLNYSATRSTNGHEGIMDKAELYATGFGVFATQRAANGPDLMYNQRLTFNFVGDLEDPLKGYWTYAPQKYWPTDVASTRFCAYAPYVELPLADGGTTEGIIGMSSNTETTPYIIYRRPLHPETCVDVMWSYNSPTAIAPLTMTMRHALARIRVSVTLTSALAANTKLLVKKITLSGTTVKKAKLLLNTAGNIPAWTEQETESRTIVIDSNPTNADSYGVVAEKVRYQPDLPYAWQPQGLEKDVTAEALSTLDRSAFIYLIPQTEQRLSCKLTCCLVGSDGSLTTFTKTAGGDIRFPADESKAFEGNTTYHLNLKIALP